MKETINIERDRTDHSYDGSLPVSKIIPRIKKVNSIKVYDGVSGTEVANGVRSYSLDGDTLNMVLGVYHNVDATIVTYTLTSSKLNSAGDTRHCFYSPGGRDQNYHGNPPQECPPSKDIVEGFAKFIYRVEVDYSTNEEPIVTLNTPNSQTLYENTAFNINGNAKDVDVGNVVSTYYRINGGDARAMTANVSDGSAAIPFNEQLTFKSGKLYKGNTAITGDLAEGRAHTLEVWAEDNKDGKSVVQTRTFYVVPNRPPTLTVNPVTNQNGMIKSDKVTISGTSNDPDGNNVKVAYRLNGGAPVEVHNGAAGPFSFDLTMTALKDGENTVIVEVSDTYDVKVSKTVKINRTVNGVAVNPSVQRYKIQAEAGGAKKVQFWVRRHPDQTLSADVSMTDESAAENYESMTLVKSTNASDGSYVEDEFVYESDEDKENIILKLTLANDKPVFSISGALY